jgi:hypothetical protein
MDAKETGNNVGPGVPVDPGTDRTSHHGGGGRSGPGTGIATGVSESVLEALAQALQLDEAERAYLFA